MTRRSSGVRGVVATVVAAMLVSVVAVSLPAPPAAAIGWIGGTIERISVDMNGGDPNGASSGHRVSDNGRYVVFQSDATDLVPGDTNGFTDVFLRDRQLGTTTLISRPVNPALQANGRSYFARISNDGAYVSFSSEATNLVSGSDINATFDGFVLNRSTGALVRVTNSSGSTASNVGGAVTEFLPAAGGVIISSRSTNFGFTVPPNRTQLYTRNTPTSSIQLLSKDGFGDAGNSDSLGPVLTYDGRYVVYTTYASNISPEASSGLDGSVLVRLDRFTGVHDTLFVRNGTAQGTFTATGISYDGQRVLFVSRHNDITSWNAEPPTDNDLDVFLFDRAAGTTQLMSATPQGGYPSGDSWNPTMDPGAGFVAIETTGAGMVAGDPNPRWEILFRDVAQGVNHRILADTEGGAPDGRSQFPVVVPEEPLVVFSSEATDLVAGDGNGVRDIFAVPLVPDENEPPNVECGLPDGLWHADNVAIGCTAFDFGSGLADPADASFSLSTTVPDGEADAWAETTTRQVCDRAGNCTTAGPVFGNRVDRADPDLQIAEPWFDAQYTEGDVVLADYSCDDWGSGVTSCDGTVASGQPLDTSIGTHQFTVEAIDAVGNTSSVTRTYQVYGASLGGRLLDADTSQPVAGATVRVYPVGSSTPLVTMLTATDGTWDFFDLPGGAYQVSFSKSGAYLTTWYSSSATRAGATTVVLPAGGWDFFYEYVAPVADPEETPAPPEVTCDPADGQWHADNVAIACTAFDAESGLRLRSDASFSLSTTVAPGVETASAATGTRQVCDRVGLCTTAGPIGGNQVDRRGPTVTIASPSTGATLVRGQTANASYSCTDAGSGAALCNGTVASGSPVDTSTLGPASLSVLGTDAVGNMTTVERPYTVVADGLVGTVTDEVSGLPVAGANVRLWRVGTSSATYATVTGADGAYAFEGVAAGSYNVQVSKTGSIVPEWFPNSRVRTGGSVLVLGPGIRRTVSPVVAAPAVLQGTVTDLDSGAPVEGATVRVFESPTAAQPLTTVTTAFDGTWSVGNLLAGSYQVQVSHPTHRTTWHAAGATRAGAASIAVTAASTVPVATAIDDLGTVGVVRGRVTSSVTGLPLGNANVRAWVVGTQTYTYVLTDADGRYEIEVDAGTYQVQVARSSYLTSWWQQAAIRPSSTPVTVGGGTQQTLDVTLTPK